jgi:NitT/TauT family transport system permease protein
MKLIEPLSIVPKRIWTITAVVEAAVALLVWQVSGGGGLIPGPLKVLGALVELLKDPDFIQNLLNSICLTLFSMGLSILIALIIGYLSVIPLFNPIARFVTQCRYLTLTGLIFLFTLLTKNGSDLKVSLLLFGIIPFFVTSLTAIISEINTQEYDLCRTLRYGTWETVWEVIVRGRADQVLEVMRQNFAISWLMITMVEGLSMSEGGIGVMLIKANKYINLPRVFALLIIIFVLGLLFDLAFNKSRLGIFAYCRLERAK